MKTFPEGIILESSVCLCVFFVCVFNNNMLGKMLHFDLIVPNCFKLSDLGLSCYSFIPVLRFHIF